MLRKGSNIKASHTKFKKKLITKAIHEIEEKMVTVVNIFNEMKLKHKEHLEI